MKYGEYGDTLSLEMPYKTDDYAMVLLVPKNLADFARWESEMTIQKLNLIRRSMEMDEVSVRIPKFTVENQFELNEPLQQLGMTTAFDPDRADFSKITGDRKIVCTWTFANFLTLHVNRIYIQIFSVFPFFLFCVFCKTNFDKIFKFVVNFFVSICYGILSKMC